MFYRKSLLALAILPFIVTATYAQSDSNQSDTDSSILPTISIQAQKIDHPYVAQNAASLLKSDAPLFETAQAVSVVTREQLDQKQATTLAEAINGIAGVVSGQRGRRGWDDFNIRGQSANNQIFIDGLRTSARSAVAVDLSGIDQVQVLKGPASVNFGQVAPGGLVNLVTKRPEAENFSRTDLSYGSYDFKQATFDLNYAPQNTEKGAFRLSGRYADQDDPVDYVYFKNLYISPTYNFDLGEHADLSVIASYQHREYQRYQGAPLVGTLLPSSLGKIDSSFFSGDPASDPYKADVYRAGWNFKYDFGNELVFRQNAAVQKTEMNGGFISLQAGGTETAVKRRLEVQDWDYTNYTIDQNLQKTFQFGQTTHELLLGLDVMQEKRETLADRCNFASINPFQPHYNQGCITALSLNSHSITELQDMGLYARNRIDLGDQWIINLSGRYDWAKSSSENVLKGTKTDPQDDQAFTGNASVMYLANQFVAPYISYATSFIPNIGTDKNDALFEPEKGKQYEIGMKFQSADQQIQGALSWFDLRRQNVLVNDPTDINYQITEGEQTTRGIEAEVNAALSDRWTSSVAYAYTYDSKTTKSTELTAIGERLENTPEHTYSLMTRYRPQGVLGWYVGAGITGASATELAGLNVELPAYTIYNAAAGYDTEHWGAQLSIRNLFDKNYYSGVIDNRVVAFGNPRQVNFAVKFKY
ncbi:TonB-dependent siderophore receptor [Acinetobacter albensis]|uniref:Iron complex outermembrane recepter protein n=1 Tax=Acinetobacter albensis TaxID=1673609 RepID=A0A1C4GS50_9GAMM|nr:TonB-dependent siderophore receptor [Acinetobacter albensis]SCC71047.1 iron complex outermembrane recepter protein [Acinetobacter albensis]